MKIKISDTAAVDAALKRVNGGAVDHTITSADMICEIASMLEARLDRECLTPRERTGTIATYVPPGPKQLNAWSVVTTEVKLRRGRGDLGWSLVGVERAEILPASPADVRITITKLAADKIHRRATWGYFIAA